MSIVETSVKASAKRITYGIEMKVGTFTLNEWGLHESQAKQVHEKLVSQSDAPFSVGAITFSRRAVSDLSAALAEAAAAPAPQA